MLDNVVSPTVNQSKHNTSLGFKRCINHITNFNVHLFNTMTYTCAYITLFRRHGCVIFLSIPLWQYHEYKHDKCKKTDHQSYPANIKHLYNIYTTSAQHCINVIQIFWRLKSIPALWGLVIFACFDFREFVIWGLFTKSSIRELSISIIASAHNNHFHEILKFANLSSPRKLKPHKYYQIYSIRKYVFIMCPHTDKCNMECTCIFINMSLLCVHIQISVIWSVRVYS